MKDKEYELLKIGLTEGEAKVYLALIELGASTVGPIVKKARVAYSNVYDVLNRLIKKGIVSYIIKSRTKYFQAASPSNLMNYLDKREEEIFKQKEALQKAIPKFAEMQKIQSKVDAEIFTGKKGLISAYQKLLADMEPKDEDLFFYIHEKEYAKQTDMFYLTNKELLNKPNRGITNPTYKNSPVVRKLKFFNIRYVDFPIPGNIEVCKDRVMIISWKEPIIATLIHSKGIADNIRNYFNSVWKIAKKK